MTSASRVDNSVKNVSYGLLLTAIGAIISFVNRTFFIKYLGPEYLGLNGLFTEVISVISLAELGVGMAINYSLYRPIHENDTERISQLMALFRKTYNIICVAVLVIGLIVLPFVHLIVTETTYPVSYIRLVFFLFLVNTSVSYLFSYNTSYIGANQRQYVLSLISTIAKVVFSVFAILVLVLTRNYVLFLILIIVQTLTTNVVATLYVKRHFPFIDYSLSLSKEDRSSVFRDIKNIFIKRVSGVITSSTDNILISALVSTVQVGYYSNYTMFFSLVRTLKLQFTTGIKASIGDLSVSESPERCNLVLKRLTFMYYCLAFVICSCLLMCSSDIISVWLGSEYVMAELIVMVAIFNLYMEIWSEPLWQYLEVSGLFKQDRNIAILGSVVNLVVSLVLGKMIGIVGIFLGTVCTQLIQLVLKTRLLFTRKFSLSAGDYWLIVGKCFLSFLLLLLVYYACEHFVTIGNIWISILVKGLIALLGSVVVITLLFIRTDEFSYTIDFVKSLLKKWKKS